MTQAAEDDDERTMDIYGAFVLFHVIGAVVLEISVLGLLVSMIVLHRRQLLAPTHRSLAMATRFDRAVPVGAALVLGTGLYMVTRRWGWEESWLIVGLAGLLLVAPISPTLISPALRKAEDATPVAYVPARAMTAGGILAGASVGELLLMLMKPSGFIAPLLVVASAAAIGGAIGYLSARAGREL